jgi:archaellin
MVDSVLTEVYFTVGIISGGESIDFTDTSNSSNVVVISYSDAYQVIPSINWTMTQLNTINEDNMLDNSELFQIKVDLGIVSANISDEQKPGPYHTFQLEVKPPIGAVLVLERTLPARINQIVNLY